MSSSATITVTSRLPAPPAAVWAHASSMEGVNYELRPLVRMTVPAALRGRGLDEAELDTVLFQSVLLVGGVLPFDRHALKLVKVQPGRGFQERSTSLLHKRWEHDRTIVADGEGSLVTDRVTFEPRFGSAGLERAVVAAIFRHRHGRLTERFGRG